MVNNFTLGLIASSILTLGFATFSLADSFVVTKKKKDLISFNQDFVYAEITNVTPNYKQISTNRPQKVCREENFPVYGKVKGQGASGLDVLGGAIIGGLFGKALTNKDEGAAAGAVIGGVVAAESGKADKTQIIGYEQKTKCSTQYVERLESILDNYTIYYQWNNQYGSAVVDRKYSIGDKVAVVVIITMLSGQ